MKKQQEKIKEIEKLKEEQYLLRSIIKGYLVEIDKKLDKLLNIAAERQQKQ